MVNPLLNTMVWAYALGALAALILSRKWGALGTLVGHAATILGALAGLAAGVSALLLPAGAAGRVELPVVFPFVRMALEVDGLSGFFLCVISVGALAAGIYAPSYLDAHQPQGRARRRSLLPQPATITSEMLVLNAQRAQSTAAFLLNVFVLAMSLVVCAADGFLFLFLWEVMTLASYFLVTSNRRDGTAVRAGFIYVVMAHVGTAFIIFVFVFLAQQGQGFGFSQMRAAAAALPEGTRTGLFLALLVGFGTKAGLIPLHVWLPLAHPAAPSHVSALMSGVMLKTAVYGMLRFGLGMAGAAGTPELWGWVVLGAGTLSAVLGVLYAYQEADLKRLLGYSSIENMGIIFMGLGAALLLRSRGLHPLAAVALAAALYHVLSHAAFKGVLFLAAGSVQARAHTLNMEDLGGLIRRMPWTAGWFLLGAMSISALPPLAGFVSEWMTFQALLFTGSTAPSGLSRLVGASGAAMLAMTSGLAAATFVKAVGVTFLGRGRTPLVDHAQEAPAPMLGAMAFLGVLCVLLGVLPGAVLPLLDGPTQVVMGHAVSTMLTSRGPLVLAVGSPDGALQGATLGTGLVAAVVLVLGLGVTALVRRTGSSTLRAETWTCGMTPHERFGYTGLAFSKAIRLIFHPIYRSNREVKQTFASPYIPARVVYAGGIQDVFQRSLYTPATGLMLRLARRVRSWHTGGVHAYLAWVLLSLIVTLYFFARG